MKLFSIVAISVLFIPSLAEAAVSTYAVVMTAQQEAAPSTSTATGSTTLAFDDVTRRLTGTLTYAGLSGAAVAGHIHEAACGVSGDVDESLGVLASPTAIDVVLDSAEEKALVTNRLYLDVHTALRSDGEIRGQILGAGSPMCTGAKPQGSAGVALGTHVDDVDAATSPADASAPCSSSTASHTDAGAAAATSTTGGDVGCAAGGSAPGAAWIIAAALVLATSRRRRRPVRAGTSCTRRSSTAAKEHRPPTVL